MLTSIKHRLRRAAKARAGKHRPSVDGTIQNYIPARHGADPVRQIAGGLILATTIAAGVTRSLNRQ
ncbi:hypothetical protein [Streptomyces sioyaensis]|uniref:hypothetical protein n=1 Tax=Streptomyces sioyaensis TaxID=67364 RepID=UPI0036F10A23